MSIKVKICGLTNLSDAQLASEAGADYLGFVFEPSSPRFCAESQFLAQLIPSTACQLCAVYGSQITHPPPAECRVVQAEIETPSVGEFWRVLRAKPHETIHELLRKAMGHTTVVLDTFHPNLEGGTGQTSDWTLAAEFVKEFPGKVVLAGGLNPTNVRQAIETVSPWAVDASSGLERVPGQKDPAKLVEFVQAARQV
ncbi:phosphoribosylanthranilate isomerase [Kamptonema cortianum]|nr:phosphoribosylanthranilate isomerase [Geitlerinema splendidum]MDK3158551.1 phosphoribosylanthranilate isomerase [Kamptonema cortianum]